MKIVNNPIDEAKKIIFVDELGKDILTGVQIIKNIEEAKKVIVVKSDGSSI